MEKEISLRSKNIESTKVTDLIIDSIQDIKGKNIVKLDLREVEESPSDYFIICEGDSNTQISAIANNIEKRMKEELGVRAAHVEGKMASKWVLVDFFDVIVHIFYPETRSFYDIEDLWSDGITTEYQNI